MEAGYRMQDPYKILGVDPSATDEEIKKAYRNLARKYHPDRYASDPDMAELASEKMKEVNTAYDEICERRSRGETGNSYGYGYSYGGETEYETSSSDPRYREIRAKINSGNAGDLYFAESTLLSFPSEERGAEWSFLFGCVLARKGNYIDAQRYFDAACNMDPTNAEYMRAREELRNRFSNAGYNTTAGSGCSVCEICGFLMCTDCCCDIMGGNCC